MDHELNMKEKYRAIKSSNRGAIYIQGGSVFDEGGNYIGPAPAWGPDLFMQKGEPTDPFEAVLKYAAGHVKEFTDALDDIFDEKQEETKKWKSKKKVGNAARHSSGTV